MGFKVCIPSFLNRSVKKKIKGEKYCVMVNLKIGINNRMLLDCDINMFKVTSLVPMTTS